MTDRKLEQVWLERNRLANVAAVDGEMPSETSDWELIERIRSDERREVPAMPYDCEKL